jgi:hypothetical protein
VESFFLGRRSDELLIPINSSNKKRVARIFEQLFSFYAEEEGLKYLFCPSTLKLKMHWLPTFSGFK